MLETCLDQFSHLCHHSCMQFHALICCMICVDFGIVSRYRWNTTNQILNLAKQLCSRFRDIWNRIDVHTMFRTMLRFILCPSEYMCGDVWGIVFHSMFDNIVDRLLVQKWDPKTFSKSFLKWCKRARSQTPSWEPPGINLLAMLVIVGVFVVLILEGVWQQFCAISVAGCIWPYRAISDGKVGRKVGGNTWKQNQVCGKTYKSILGFSRSHVQYEFSRIFLVKASA